MANRGDSTPAADPLASDLDPGPDTAVLDTPPPGAGSEDSVPRLMADDGQGGRPAAIPTDDTGFQSDLAPEADETTEQTATQPTIAPIGQQPTREASVAIPSNLTPEQMQRYAAIGMQMEAMNGAPPAPNFDFNEPQRPDPSAAIVPDRGPITRRQVPADLPEDPELDKLSDHMVRRAGLDRVSERLDRVTAFIEQQEAAQRQARRADYERQLGNYVHDFVDNFNKTNDLAKDDEDVQDMVREHIVNSVNRRLDLERAGQQLPPINWRQALAQEAVNAAFNAKQRFANRERRRTAAVQDVAQRTVSTTGGIAPRPGQTVKPKSEKERSDDLYRNAVSAGWGA